jgi:hypothetical protein
MAKKPTFGSDKTKSYIEFINNDGAKVRFGVEGSNLFIAYGENEVNMIDDQAILAGNGIRAVSPEITSPVTTVSIEEYTTGRDIVSILTLTNFIVGHIPAAAAALAVGNIVCAYPASGFHIEVVSYYNLSFTLPGTVVNADVGLGSVIASNAVNVLSGTASFEDRITGQTVATDPAGGTAVPIMTAATAGPLTGISINNSANIKNVFLNAAGTWNVNNHSDLYANGTIVLKWTKIA